MTSPSIPMVCGSLAPRTGGLLTGAAANNHPRTAIHVHGCTSRVNYLCQVPARESLVEVLDRFPKHLNKLAGIPQKPLNVSWLWRLRLPHRWLPILPIADDDHECQEQAQHSPKLPSAHDHCVSPLWFWPSWTGIELRLQYINPRREKT